MAKAALGKESRPYSFYQALTVEWHEHRLVLLGPYEYLIDPVGWFTKKEHWFLSGV